MRHIFAIGGDVAAPILVSLLFVVAACNPSKQTQDIDIVQQDVDIIQQDHDLVTAETETIMLDDAVVVENEGDILDDSLVSDTDTFDPDCPPLISAPFPYYKQDGSIHFCRKCDTPTAKDPQCVSNLWKEANLLLTTKYPDYDCYPYPCDMPNLKARTMEEFYSEHPDAPEYVPMHECDLQLVPDGWSPDGSHGAIKHFNLSAGKIGFIMDGNDIDARNYKNDYKLVLFDVADKTYHVLGPSFAHGMVYYKGSALTVFSDARGTGDYRYLGYFTVGGTYRVVYPKPIYLVGYTPVLNDKWVQANIQETETGASATRYAKVGEWKWTTLTNETNRHPSIQGDYLSVRSIYHGYVCNLSKSPQKLTDCFHVNRENEWFVFNIQFDEENPQRFIYTSTIKTNGVNKMTMVLVEMNGERANWKYTDILTAADAQADVYNLYTFYIVQFRGNMILFHESGNVGSDITSLACYYRLDQKKRYCMKKMENEIQYESGTIMYVYGDSEFEGKYFLYQKINSTPFILRDMDCYCEKEGVCPFEGMKK